MVEFEKEQVRELLGRVVAAAPIILFVVDGDGIFQLSEGQGLEKLGLTPGEVVGKSAFEVYAGAPEVAAAIERALKGDEFSVTVRVWDTTWETHYKPIVGPDGRKNGTIGVALDISERLAAEKADAEYLRKERNLRMEAERASRSKDEFLALLSHELRTPMTAMLGWTFLLRTGDMDSAEFRSALDAIERNMNAQAQIIEDLLDVSRIVTGKVRLETRPIEVDSIVEAAVDVVRPAAAARKIALSVAVRDPGSVVTGDPARLQQALWNLVSNAVKFSDEGTAVDVEVSASDGHATILVADQGAGIHPDTLPILFDPFTQAEESLTREHGGLGLGLAIVRHIVDLHGGRIEATSEGRGKGSRFTIILPLAEGGETPIPAEKAGRDKRTLFGKVPDLDGVNILVVDDDADTRKMLKAVLDYAKADVTLAANASEGFAAVGKNRFDVLIVDIAMPGEDGHSLLRRIRELGPEKGGDVPAAAVTARVAVEDRTAALKAGFQMYLPKPVEPAELVVVVEALARKSG